MPHSTKLRLIAITSILSLAGILTGCVSVDQASSDQDSGVGVVLGPSSSEDSNDTNDTASDDVTVQGVSNEPSTTPPVTVDNTSLTLTWQPNSTTLDGYLVYYGASSNTATKLISDIKAYSGSFDFSAPALQYASWYDLGLQPGETVCFKIRAYNADGLSDWSEAVCGVIPQTSA